MTKQKSSSFRITGIVAAACLFYAISGGIRSNYGLIRGAISDSSGVEYASISFILAVAQLSFGVMQPVFGVLAFKKSNAFVLGCGAVTTTIGLGAIPLCHTEWMLMLFLGLLMPIGLGAFSFGVIMGAITPFLGEQQAAAASGLVSASNGLGSIILAPVLSGMLDHAGLSGAILSLSIPTACLIPVVVWISKSDPTATEQSNAEKEDPLRTVLASALTNRSYVFLMFGFFTCGFHMAIIETHLYSHFASYGFPDEMIAYAFSVYGITSMLGSVVSGFLGSRFPMQKLLGLFYGSRTIWIAGFLLLPKTLVSAYVFAAFLGLTGAATVPPTSGLVSRLYGPHRLGTLFGVVFVAHQVGSFFSAWLGGVCLSVTGGYTLIWCASAVLSLLAAIVSFFIRKK